MDSSSSRITRAPCYQLRFSWFNVTLTQFCDIMYQCLKLTQQDYSQTSHSLKGITVYCFYIISPHHQPSPHIMTPWDQEKSFKKPNFKGSPCGQTNNNGYLLFCLRKTNTETHIQIPCPPGKSISVFFWQLPLTPPWILRPFFLAASTCHRPGQLEHFIPQERGTRAQVGARHFEVFL